MNLPSPLALCLVVSLSVAGAADENIRWLVEYEGSKLPAAPWSAQGKPEAEIADGALKLADSSIKDFGFYRAEFPAPDADSEIVVEATLRVKSMTGVVHSKPTSKSCWPWRDGVPIGIFVSDGKHEEGLVFMETRVSNWTDRFIVADTTDRFHTCRAVIRGTQMDIEFDGQKKIHGQNAFWKPSESGKAFIQFGSSSEDARGEAEWRSVRLGVRKASGPVAIAPVKITVSEPWMIKHPNPKVKVTRPYLYDAGGGKLLVCLAEGPDAIYEPYGLMMSSDAGKTWTPVEGLDVNALAPLPILKLRDGSVIGASRWTWQGEGGTHVGQTVRWDAGLSKFTAKENSILLPPEYRGKEVTITVERRLFENQDGSLLLSGYTRTGPSTPEGRRVGGRHSHLVRSTDGGIKWDHYAMIGPGAEPAIMQTSPGKFTALLRTGPFKPFDQTFSEDGGKTWTKPVPIEEGSVCADLIVMSNGLLACSYGRPASCLMFSADEGKTWTSHHVISNKTGFNYSGIVEVKPGRLLYLHDGGGLQGVYIDVERVTR